MGPEHTSPPLGLPRPGPAARGGAGVVYGRAVRMASCGRKAVLIVTKQVPDTSTNVARRRIDLACGLPAGHEGRHRDLEHEEQWDGGSGPITTLFRHEDEEPESGA